MPETNETFEEAIRKVINSYSKENDSDTPDFVLAQYLLNCLESFNKAVKARDKYFGVDMWQDDKIAKKGDTVEVR